MINPLLLALFFLNTMVVAPSVAARPVGVDRCLGVLETAKRQLHQIGIDSNNQEWERIKIATPLDGRLLLKLDISKHEGTFDLALEHLPTAAPRARFRRFPGKVDLLEASGYLFLVRQRHGWIARITLNKDTWGDDDPPMVGKIYDALRRAAETCLLTLS